MPNFDVDWKAVQRDRNRKRMTLKELARKYAVSTSTICINTKPAPDKRKSAWKKRIVQLRKREPEIEQFPKILSPIEALREYAEFLKKCAEEVEEAIRILEGRK